MHIIQVHIYEYYMSIHVSRISEVAYKDTDLIDTQPRDMSLCRGYIYSHTAHHITHTSHTYTQYAYTHYIYASICLSNDP